MAVRFKARFYGRLLAGIAGSNPAGAWMSVRCECCVLSARGFRVGLITGLEESFRERVYVCVLACALVCVIECDQVQQ